MEFDVWLPVLPNTGDPQDDRNRHDDEAPETPLDEPMPIPVDDPPQEPDPSPYVVLAPAGADSVP